LNKIKKYIFPSVLFSALFFIVLSFLGDSHQIFLLLKEFPLSNLLIVLAFSLAVFVVRLIKWQFYLIKTGEKVPLKDVFLSFFAALSLNFSPGKIGDLLKSYYLNERHSVSFTKTFMIILMERMTEVYSLILIVFFGSFFFGYYSSITILIFVLSHLLIFIIIKKKHYELIHSKLQRFGRIQKYMKYFQSFYGNLIELLKLKIFIPSMLLSLLSWIFEFFAIFTILTTFKIKHNFYEISYFYSFSTLLGSISFLPAGIGIMDASFSFILILLGFDENSALASTIMIRISTLWFGILLGILTLIIFRSQINFLSKYD